MAAIVLTFGGYVAVSFLPPLAWLLFYLHEDRHPEPKHLLLLTFVAGMVSAIVAAFLEVLALGNYPGFTGVLRSLAPSLFPHDGALTVKTSAYLFLVIAAIEEIMKYAAVRWSVLRRRDFDEPVDAMIYMVTAALGFAAVENVLFVIPAFESGLQAGFQLTASRFLGANLLHALSSAIVGYFLARHHFSPWRHHAVASGLVIATVLHALFNYLIIAKDVISEAVLLLVLMLSFMAIDVFVDFARLNRMGKKEETPEPANL